MILSIFCTMMRVFKDAKSVSKTISQRFNLSKILTSNAHFNLHQTPTFYYVHRYLEVRLLFQELVLFIFQAGSVGLEENVEY